MITKKEIRYTRRANARTGKVVDSSVSIGQVQHIQRISYYFLGIRIYMSETII